MMDEYRDIECICKMNEQYKEIFYSIVNEYGKKLSERVVMPGSAFTLHDFDHHCFNIYKIISNILFDNRLVYLKDYGLCQKELFILNLAVLFHDIGMANVLGAVRENHSVMSAEFIQKEYDDPRSTFRKKADLSANEVKALKAIVIAHSNVKDGSVELTKNGLNSPDLRNYPARSGVIRTLFLAGILRIADELDVSSERLGTGEIEQEIEEGKKKYEILKKKYEKEVFNEELEAWEGYLRSLEHWKKLHLIEGISRNDADEAIELLIDDEYILRCLDEGQTEKSLARIIADIYIEIEKKFREAEEVAFSNIDVSKYVAVKKVKVVTTLNKLEKEIFDNLSIRRLNLSKQDDIIEKKDVPEEKKVPIVIDENLEKEIYNEVNLRGLVKFGHFLLNDCYCARDWIDTRELVETKKILTKLVDVIVRDINSKQHNDFVIIGVGLVGVLLASRIAFTLQRPLTYIVPEKDEKHNVNQEIKIDVEEGKDIILLTDAIVTFDTITRAVDKYSLEEHLDSIYTIFYRPSDVENNRFLEKTFSVNNMFKIELFPKSKCVYKSNHCIALNRRINEGGKK